MLDGNFDLKKFKSQLKDMYATAQCKYLNNDQYNYYREIRNELDDYMQHTLCWLDNMAACNTIMCMESNLKLFVKKYNAKSIADIDRVINDFGTIDGPGDAAVLGSYKALRLFCDDYPDIAGKYIAIK